MEASDDTGRLHLITHSKNDGRSIFPKDFIDAIRDSIDAGFTAEQITSILLLSTSVLAVKGLDGPELIGRAKEVSTVMGGLSRHKMRMKK